MFRNPFRKKGRENQEGPGDPLAESVDFLTGDPAKDRRSLQLLLDAISEVATTLEPSELLQSLVDKSLEVTRSERGFLLLLEEGGELRVEVARDRPGHDLPLDTHYSKSVTQKVLDSGVPIASVVQSSREALDLGQSVYDLKLRSVMCVPLEGRSGVLGLIYVDSRAEGEGFNERDLHFFAALAHQMALSIENARLFQASLDKVRLEKELEFAQKIQARLLPKPKGLPSGIQVARWYQAVERASGDVFDVIIDPKGPISVILGDVTGHGIGPALIAHSVQAAMHSYLEILEDLSEVVSKMNHRFVAGLEVGTFMSLLLARIEHEGGRRYLRWVNAGHSGSWLVQKAKVLSLENSSSVVGLDANMEFPTFGPLPLEKGDLLFLCSDGLFEARNAQGDFLGEAAVQEILERSHGLSAETLLDRVRTRLQDHLGETPLDDDVMLLSLSLSD
jgi:sigma-B regulation protein RsbU (phosphoserine phosphatase)